jgi:phosphatidylglycerol:prolipoprotein diacylglycerol transferase
MPAPFAVEPFVVHVGPLELTGFGVAMAAAFAIAHVTLRRELARRGHLAEADATPDVVTAAVLGTLVGGKLYSVILQRDLATLWSRTGFVFWGGFIGAVLCCWAVIHRKRLSFPRIADAAGHRDRGRLLRSGARGAGRSATTTAGRGTGRSR